MRLSEYLKENLSRVMVLLDSHFIRSPQEADNEEGWVEIPDLTVLSVSVTDSLERQPHSPPDFAEDPLEGLEEVEIPTKRIYGKVEFRTYEPPKES